MQEDALERIKEVKSLIDGSRALLQTEREELQPFQDHVAKKLDEFKEAEHNLKMLDRKLKGMKKEFRRELKRLGSELDDFESGKEPQ